MVVFFGATLLRSALGFGEALIAVPLLAFVLPVKVAEPIAVLVSSCRIQCDSVQCSGQKPPDFVQQRQQKAPIAKGHSR